MIIGKTARLILREVTVEDAEDFFQIYNDPVNMRFMGGIAGSKETELENLKKHISNYYQKYGFGLWAVVLKENKKIIGRCGFLLLEVEGKKEPELSYIIDRKFCGRGFATEAAKKALQIGFEKFGFERIIAAVKPQNVASVNVAEKIGMKFEKEVEFEDFGAFSIYATNAI